MIELIKANPYNSAEQNPDNDPQNTRIGKPTIQEPAFFVHGNTTAI